MLNASKLFKFALLGSAVAIAALAPAAGADTAQMNLKRMRAIQGNHPVIKNSGVSGSISAEGTYTDLHDFAGGANDGAGPGANVTLDGEGNIYGTTDFGGAHGDGVVFKLAPDGTQTILHAFAGSDGSAPDGGVVLMAS